MGVFWLVRGALVFVAATALGCASHSAAPAAPAPSTASTPAVSASAPLPAAAAPSPEPPASTAAPAPAPPSIRSPRALGEMCGGIAGFQCQDKLYCAFPPASHCGAGDMAGTCQAKPEICTDLYAAVCGCDGKTYPNLCYAQRTGVSVASSGACKP